MAKHIPFGEPVNEAERWAFAFLRNELPPAYTLLTNVELIGNYGQPLECDAIVLGEWAVYVVDVKGYAGRVRAGKDVWLIGDREVANPLPRVNQNARILAGKIRKKASYGQHAPWCQGAAFITGNKGSDIHLNIVNGPLCAFSPNNIIKALTTEQFILAPQHFRVTQPQKQLALDVIGQIGLIQEREKRVQDFHKVQKIGDDDHLQIWLGKFTQGDLEIPYVLKILDTTAFADADTRRAAERLLREEFRLLQELTGLSGVPYAAPLIDTGEQLVLPIRHPRGKPLSLFDPDDLDIDKRVQGLLAAFVALRGFHTRGVVHGNIGPDSLFFSDAMECEFIDFDVTGRQSGSWPAPQDQAKQGPSVAGDIFSLAATLCPWFAKVLRRTDHAGALSESHYKFELKDDFKSKWEGLEGWFSDALAEDPSERPSLEDLRAVLTAGVTSVATKDHVEAEFDLKAGAVVDGKYKVIEHLGEGEYSNAWRCRHLLGQFDCSLKVYDQAEESFEAAKKEFGLLSRLYHPSINRSFDMGRIEAVDQYYISMAYVPGLTLREAMENAAVTAENSIAWFIEVLTALQYLHNGGTTHRNITPESIIVDDSHAVLIDFSMLPETNRRTGNVSYKDRRVLSGGWRPVADLYSLCLTFLEVWSGSYPAAAESGNVDRSELHVQFDIPDETINAIIKILNHETSVGGGTDYLELFGLSEKESMFEEIPSSLARKWGISKGYMAFLVLDMVNDPRPRSRNQWVLNALRSRSIAGNRINRASMSATVSRLKAAGIAEDFGKKIRLTRSFREDWEKAK
jgi:serine/threonine protein kinase